MGNEVAGFDEDDVDGARYEDGYKVCETFAKGDSEIYTL